MEREIAMVRDFHLKHGFGVNLKLADHNDVDTSEELTIMGLQLVYFSRLMQAKHPDGRRLRVHLMLEELGETMIRMAAGDEVGVLDGLGDLTYVVNGTAVFYGLPLAQAFEEIHASNMTKAKKSSDPNNHRLRDKGDSYRPPDLAGVLGMHKYNGSVPAGTPILEHINRIMKCIQQ